MKWKKKRLTDQRFLSGLLSTVCLCVLASCSEQPTAPVSAAVERIPFTPLSTLDLELSTNPGPTLVEFAQDFNCARCDQMVSTMDDLRSGFSKDVIFHRVNYLSAANQFQLGICPSYMLVLDGQVVGQFSGNQTYPILASRLDDLVATHRQSDEHLNSFKENENEPSKNQ